MKEFPSPDHFPRIQTLALSYSYHCCSYLKLNLDKGTPTGGSSNQNQMTNGQSDLTETILWLPNKKQGAKDGKTPSASTPASAPSPPSLPEDPPSAKDDDANTQASSPNQGLRSDISVTNMIFDGGGRISSSNTSSKNISLASVNKSTATTLASDINISSELTTDTSYYDIDQVWKNILAGNSKDYNLAYNQYIEEYFEDYKSSYAESSDNSRSNTNYVRYPIQCLPQPGE